MAITINEISENLPLQAVLSIYARQNKAYVEFIEVDNGKFKPGVPLAIDQLESLYQFLYRHKTGSKTLHGVVPPEMIYMNNDLQYFVFIVPPGIREFLLTPELKKKFKQRTMLYPGMIFKINDEEISVFVYEGKEPSFDRPIWPAPFYNIDRSGSLCTGSATMDFVHKAQTYYEFIQAWQNVLFRSKYSHGVDGRESNSDDFMRQCIVKKSFNWKVFKKKFNRNKLKLEKLFL